MQNISNPFEGSLVYVNTENCLYQYNGTEWIRFWKSDGNTTNSSDFIGTTNNQDFTFRTNNIPRMNIENDGSVGIGNLENPNNGSGHFAVTSGNQNMDFFHPNFGSISEESGIINACGNLYPLYNDNFADNCYWFGITYITFDGNIDRVIRSYGVSGDPYNNIFMRLEGRINNSSSWVTIHQFDGWWGQTSYRTFNVNSAGLSYQDFRLSRPSSGGSLRIGEIDFFQGQEPELIVADNGNVGINTSSPQERLHVIGNILASGTITPDYVFQKYYNGKSKLNPEYQFNSLEKTERFIEKNKHLPGVPNAKKIKDQGGIIINRATEINLEKIEELYLHIFELNDRIKKLEKELSIQKKSE